MGLAFSADEAILEIATSQRRIVVTAELDFPRLFARLGTSGPGLILLHGGNYSEAESLECVRQVLAAIPEADLARSIIVVDREKIRRRWLPI